MTRQASVRVSAGAALPASAPDAFRWQNPYGGIWASATNWLNTTTGTTAAVAPSVANPVTIPGGVGGAFADVTGTGAAAQLSITNNVLLWGTVSVAGGVTLAAGADLDLDAAATLTASSLGLGNGALLTVGGGSALAVSGTAALTAGFLTAISGSFVQLGGLIANAFNSGFAAGTNTISVDDISVLEVGTAGGAAPGAITIDAGQTAVVSGTMNGNIIVNGGLAVPAGGILTLDAGDPFGAAQTIAGTGTLTITESSLLTLGLPDSAAIRFAGPNAILGLNVLPTGMISGFTAGNFIELIGGATVMATGLKYSQTSQNVATLTLSKGAATIGTLTLAGNYAGSLFHLGLDTHGDGIISVRSIGGAPVQPGLIAGTAGSDTLIATANNQILTGLGGNDLLGAAGFTGIDFKDSSAALNGDTITAFDSSALIDLTDMAPATASVAFSQSGQTGTLTVTDGTRSAAITLALGGALAPGFFTTATDAATGTIVRYTAANTDAFSFAALPGGLYTTAANWQNLTTGTVAAVAPSYGNLVTFAGVGGGYTDVTGNGVAASIVTSGGVLLWDILVAGSKLAGVTGALTQSGTLVLDGAAALTLAGTATVSGQMAIGGTSTLTAAGLAFTSNAASLLAVGGSIAQVSTLAAAVGGVATAASIIGVDSTSSIEIGSLGSVSAGALTIDRGVTATLSGAINGNLVVNGTLVVAGTLAVAPFGSAGPAISGSGTIVLTYGDVLSLAGGDSAAIQFSQTASGSFGTMCETLALGTIMPTATISGLVKGDTITVGLVVTNLIWNGATLKLLNGGVTVGSLLLSGLYAANQFQVQLAPNGLSSIITYAATPSTAGGNSVNGNTDLYSWNNPNGGVWSNASQWIDITAGGTPSGAPGASNIVTIGDNPGASTAQIIYGPAAVAALTITSAANTILIGSFSIGGQFSVAQYGSGLTGSALYGGSNLTAGSLNITSPFRIANASLLTVLGSTGGTFISGATTVGGDSVLRVYSGSSVLTGMLAVDSASIVEFGTAGTASSGTLTIDYGQTLTMQGNGVIAANLVVNGNLLVYSGTIQGFGTSTGSISGTGTITIGALGGSGSLILAVPDTAPIVFGLYSQNGIPYQFESLELRGPMRTGVISGFIAGDSIIVDRSVTGAVFAQTTGGQGTLTLTNGGTTVGTLTLNGNFAASLFQVDLAPQTGIATISLQTATTALGSAGASTGNHAYNWSGASGGSWTNAANWLDATTTSTTVTVPGSGNVVLIGGSISAGQYSTIGGTGAAADLTVSGSVLLTGRVSVAGSLHVSNGSGPAAALTLAAGAVVTAGGSVEVFGRLEAGSGSALTLSGYALLYNGSMVALSGSTVQAGGLIGDGAGDVLAVDANSVIKIGSAGGATAGALTISAGAPAMFTGLIYGSVVVNGSFWTGGGATLLIDMNPTSPNDPYGSNPTITGSGTLVLTEGSTLGLGAPDSVAIKFNGPNATLLLAVLPTATISGFTTGQRIQLNLPVTALSYSQISGSTARLTLTNGAATVGSLTLAGNFTSNFAFHLDVAPNGATAVITLQALQIAAAQPTLIYGSVGTDLLAATANGQTITGQGGGDILSGGTFTAVTFKDYSFYLNGSAIQNFATSDIVDFIDMNPLATTFSYTNGILAVSDGTHAASLALAFTSAPSSGAFHVSGDGAAGAKLTWS